MNVIVFDLETTGVDIHKDEIIQIGATVWELGKELFNKDTFEVKIKPSSNGKDSLDKMKSDGFQNSYDPALWLKEGLEPYQAFPKFATWVSRHGDLKRSAAKTGRSYYVAQGCGYNAAKFDHPFLLETCRKYGIFMPMDMRCWDTMQWAMMVFAAHKIEVENFKLETVAKALDIPLENAHDALADVIATAKISAKLLKMIEK